MENIFANLQEWIALDHDESSRKYVQDLISKCEAGNKDSLREAEASFAEQISFGTAGLRSKVGIGFVNMNTITVRLATQVTQTI